MDILSERNFRNGRSDNKVVECSKLRRDLREVSQPSDVMNHACEGLGHLQAFHVHLIIGLLHL